MSTNSHTPMILPWQRERRANLGIVTFLMAAAVMTLARPGDTVREEYFTLVLLFDFVLALWAAWYLPTFRVIGLALAGALIGLCTETTAGHARLWLYDPSVGLVAGVAIHALSAVALFGVINALGRPLLRGRAGRSSGWFNAFLTLALFTGLFAAASHQPDNLHQIRAYPPVIAYYAVLFLVAVAFAYVMRLSTLLAAIVAAATFALVGEYAGGSQAHLWTFLPDAETPVTFPPLFLVLALWPLEVIVEYGLSAHIADALTYFLKVRARQRIEDGLEPDPWTPDVYVRRDEFIRDSERIRIPYYDWDRERESILAFLMRFGRRSFSRMLSDAPETGEILTAMAGLAMLALSVFEGGMTRFSWASATLLALLYGAALVISTRLYWRRSLWMGLVGMVVGWGMFAGIEVAASGVPAGRAYTGHLFWGPFCFLVFLATYGAARTIRWRLARLTPQSVDPRDRGEPRPSVGSAALVLCLLILAGLFLQGPVFGHTGPNPAFFLVLSLVLLAFCFWFCCPFIGGRHLAIQGATAAAVAALALAALGAGALPFPFWAQVGALVLAYLFTYTAGASLAAEPLTKGIRPAYWRRPKDRAAHTLRVVYHDRPHPEGLRREMRDDDLHTFPPAHCGVNVTAARQPDGTLLPIEETLARALAGLAVPWPPAGGEIAPCHVGAAVRGRKVFIKPNLVVPYGSPYTTAPELVSALVHFCLENGAASVHIGEMAISNFSSRMTLVSTGLQQYWESIDPARVIVHVMDEEEFTWVELEDAEENARHGVTFGRFFLPVALLEEDTFYIDVPKMKTHLQSSVTLGIKNAHGLVPECDRGRSHQRISQKVVDICKVWAPHLTIVDGYEALEGIGPWPGDPLPLRALVVSNDVVQADFVSTQLMKKEEMAPDFSKDVDFRAKFVKSTWLAYEQGLGSLDKDPSGGDVVRTLGADATPVPVQEWTRFLLSLQRDFRDPEVRDEHLIKNIGARFGREPHFPYPPKDVEHDFWREYLPLDGHDPVVPYQGPLVPTSQWGPARLVSDEWRHPHVGASVMFSGMFGLLKAIFEEHFPRELAMLDGFAVVYGPLRKPLECEAALLFGDGAIATEYLLFAPRVYRMAGGGKPPNRYSETFERMSQELGGHLLGFVAETLTYSRGWYW